jgi:DNA-nicking Smr family endonuclease
MSTDDGKPRRRKLSDEERTLWNRITRSVAPLRRGAAPPDSGRTPALPGKTRAAVRVPTLARADLARADSARADLAPAAKPAPQVGPFDRKLKRRLARGAVDIDARLDLHGKTQSQAHAALLRFLRKAQNDGARFVLVITGKGAREDDNGRGVLKRQVPLWLRLPEFRGYVAGLEDAHIGHGGEGALYVRLRRTR